MNILYWIILLSVEFTCCADVSDQTKSSSTPAVPNHSQSLSASDQTQSMSTPAVSEKTRTSSSSTKKLKEEDKLTLQPLPGKDNTFYQIRKHKKIFVDKTQFIEELLNDGRQCVLFTRPRRFGKSNFLQMLEAFFMGKKELFEGTHIYLRGNTDEKNEEWKEYPVVYLDFGSLADFEGEKPSMKLFKEKLYRAVQEVADFYKVGDCKKSLEFLLQKLLAKFRLPIVVLIDEYDRAFTTILHKRPDGKTTKKEEALLIGMKKAMEEVFNVIKISINKGRVRFAYVTGVAWFAFDNLPGSGPNNVVTLNDKYSCMVGFTESEIGKYLGPHIDEFAKTEDTSSKEITERLLKMYGGYLFSDKGGTEVANPVSLMECLRNKRLGNYWCTTSSAEVVIARILEDGASPASFKNIVEPVEALFERNPTHNEIPTSIYMLVYGYLTVKKYNGETVTLDYPNDEVEEVLTRYYNLYLTLEHPAVVGKDAGLIMQSLKLKNLRWLTKLLNKLGFRNNVPAEYQIEIKNEFTPTTIMYIIFKTIGCVVSILDSDIYANGPVKHIRGDLDLQIVIENVHYVFEIKYEHEDAIDGIEQLVDYFIDNEKDFLDTVTRRFPDAAQPSQFYLISMNFKKDKNGKTSFINSFVGIPFQATDPEHTTKDAAATTEPMKIWFRDLKVSSEAYKEILKRKYGSLPLDRAVW